MSRGMLTEEVKKVSLERLGYEIKQQELRLMPYVQYCVMNAQNLDPSHINHDERKIMRKWKDKGWMDGGASGLMISTEFYRSIMEILLVGYCSDMIL
jgi:hypothetical protein